VAERAWCVEWLQQMELADARRNEGFAEMHPLVRNPSRRAEVIDHLAKREGHLIGLGPCDRCKAIADSEEEAHSG
jgi:hypothetical protein